MTRILPSLAVAFALPLLSGGAVLIPTQPRAQPAPASTAAATARAPVTIAEVEAAQRAWGAALVAIATANREGGTQRAHGVALDALNRLYGFESGPVLFKPTLTTAPQTFRTTRESALAYFAGGDPAFPGDTGFALGDWRAVAIENAAVRIAGDMALTTGNVRITDGAGRVTTVDKTWAFQRDAAGALRIVLHHSSLPFTR